MLFVFGAMSVSPDSGARGGHGFVTASAQIWVLLLIVWMTCGARAFGRAFLLEWHASVPILLHLRDRISQKYQVSIRQLSQGFVQI